MKLNLLERFLLMQLLPQKENFATLKIIHNLKMALSFSEEEVIQCEVKSENGMTYWNDKGLEEVEICIGNKAKDICIQALKDADKNKLLTEKHLSLYEKFISEE